MPCSRLSFPRVNNSFLTSRTPQRSQHSCTFGPNPAARISRSASDRPSNRSSSVLLIVAESRPCVDHPLVLGAGVGPCAEEDSGQIVLRFALGEDPAGKTVLIADLAEPPGVCAFRVSRTLPVAVDDGDEPRAIRHCVCPSVDFLWHLAGTADAVESDRFSFAPPDAVKGLVEFRHDAFDERAVAVPVLDEDQERLVDQAACLLGRKFILRGWMRSHSHAPCVRSQCPGAAPSRCDEQLAQSMALPAGVADPRGGLDGVGIRCAGQVPDVPAIFDPVQNAVKPTVRVRIIGHAGVDRDAHGPSMPGPRLWQHAGWRGSPRSPR